MVDNCILWSDKFGCVYKVSLDKFSSSDPKDESNQVLVLGHCSIITQTLLCNYQKSHIIVTSDRDEKIKVSYYPHSYDIISYCMGHRSFISCLTLIESERDDELFAISGGGDGILITWELIRGKQLDSFSFDLGGVIYIASLAFYKPLSLAIVTCEGQKVLYFFNITIPEGKITHIKSLPLPSVPLSIYLIQNYLWISTLENGLFKILLQSQRLDLEEVSVLNQKLRLSDASLIQEIDKEAILKKLSLVS